MSKLLETLASELERPRELPPRVVKYIGGTYSVDYEAIGSFLIDMLPKLEDYELDLILSPVFTPKLADQAVFAEILGTQSVLPAQWPELVQQLVDRPTRGQLVTPDRQVHSVPLRGVTVERYVHRLRLEGSIPESIVQLIDRTPDLQDRPLLKAIARRPIWDNASRCNILVRYLTTALERKSYRLTDVLALLDLMESHKLAGVPDLLAWIPRRHKVLREQINLAQGPKPFFSDQVQELHGNERDQRGQDESRASAKENEFAFLERLQQLLENSDIDTRRTF